MKLPFYQRLFILLIFTLLFSVEGYAQNSRPSVASTITTGSTPQLKKAKLPVLTPKNQPTVMAACDNDLIAPEVHCPAGNCLPDARALYLTTDFNDQPWGQYDNINAMKTVFGPDNYDVWRPTPYREESVAYV